MSLPDPLITANPKRLGGTAVFADSRVPVKTLFDYLAAGRRLDDFLEDFPGISRDHAVAVLRLSATRLVTDQPAPTEAA